MKFSKIIVTNYFTKYGSVIPKANIYQLFDNETLLGFLIASNKKESYLISDNKTYIINKHEKITEEITSDLQGHFEFKNWTIFKGASYKVALSGSKYQLTKIKRNNRSEATSFILANEDTQISYTIHLIPSPVYLGNEFSETAFNGTIETDHKNPITILSGLYLIDRALDNETIY